MSRPTIDDVRKQVAEAAEAVVEYLDSPEGRRVRSKVASGLIFTAPLLSRLPVVRRTPLGRALSLLGGAALIVKAAEMIRDWEPRRVEAGGI
ncbi:MAG TPA: hypothetical protein VGR49_07050 [Actinomycetota bacterium]|nr:hypothetical protein [Actinomycetota bacterium]